MATTKIELYNGATLVATKTSAPFTSIDWTPVTTGAATLTAKRYEDGVLVATSSVKNYTVNAAAGDTTAPTITTATVEDANPSTLVVVFSEVVTITDVTGLTIAGAATPTLSAPTGSGTSTLSFTLSAPLTNGQSVTLEVAGTNNIIDAASNALVATSQAITNNVAAAGGYSATTNTVLGRMATAPSTPYKDAIGAFVDELETKGLWSKIDEIQCPALDTSANGLVGWKGVANATLFGGVTHTPKSGHVHNGTDGYTNSGFIPSTMGVQYQGASAFVARVFSSVSIPPSIGVMGIYTSVLSTRAQLNVPASGDVLMRLNTSTATTISGMTTYNTNTLYTQYRNSTDQYLYEGVTQKGTGPLTGESVASIPFFEGAANSDGTAAFFHPITQFLRIYGGGVLTAQNRTDFNNAVQTFRTAITNIA